MTSSPVNVSSYFAGPVPRTNGMEQTTKGGDFSEIFKNVKDSEPVKGPEDVKTSDEADMQQAETVAEESKADNAKETKKPEKADDVSAEDVDATKGTEAEVTDEEISEETYEQIMELLKTTISDIKELIATTLDIPKDEVEAVMDAMQIGDADLLNADTVNQICKELMGVEDMMALVTDEDLLGQMKAVDAGFKDLLQGLEESVESTTEINLKDVLQEVKQMMEETPTSETPTITVEKADEQVKPMAEKMQDMPSQGEKNTGDEAKGQQMNFASQTVFHQADALQNAANSIQQTQSATMSYAQTMDIMNQVMDFMNVSVGLEETTLHMQLHPEELGTVQVHISAKEGVMTAHFTTENEAVKTVLENQIVQLQEKFDAQNIKVEAIEISVETHGFEQNLQKGQGESGQQSQAKKKGTRRIDLNAMDSVAMLSEEERLAAEMMQANGSTVDYMV